MFKKLVVKICNFLGFIAMEKDEALYMLHTAENYAYLIGILMDGETITPDDIVIVHEGGFDRIYFKNANFDNVVEFERFLDYEAMDG